MIGYLLAASFAVLIGAKYNSVRVFDRKIRTQNISNTMWIVFYLAAACRTAFDAVRYGLMKDLDNTMNNAFFVAVMVFHGITCYTLTLSLNHQRKFRSSVPTPPATAGSTLPRESDALVAKQKIRHRVSAPEIFFTLLFILYLLFLLLVILISGQPLEITFMVVLAVQRIPILCLMAIIVFVGPQVSSSTTADGPSKKSKIFLFCASVVDVFCDVPLQLWAYILPDSCIFALGSWVDMIHIISFLAPLFFFLFLRSEYLRNMEETIWTTVSQIQDTFDFRRFN